MSECLVMAKDYTRYWSKEAGAEVEAPIWDGKDLRIGPADRRAQGHERRWNREKGRRYRLVDRRKS